ncbi:MAG: hypothetical protein ACRDD7_00915 [Peptostreptococcaceae bacterium]
MMFKFILGAVLLLILFSFMIIFAIKMRIIIEDFLEKKYNNDFTILSNKVEGKVIEKEKKIFMTNLDYFVNVKTKNGMYTLDNQDYYRDLIVGETYIFHRIIHKNNNTGRVSKDYLKLM